MPTTYEIHPAIGVARLGVSDGFFVGPEPDGSAPSDYRDGQHQLKRQGARFRVFACERDARDRLVHATELTAGTTDIEWTVQLANRKAVAKRILQGGTPRRNGATGHDAADAQLIISPSSHSVTRGVPRQLLDDGQFKGHPVPLGEILFESPSGRLIVLSAHGKSESPSGTQLQRWAESDDWYDNVADGPVKARVTIKQTQEVVEPKGAWVLVAPPAFAPGIQNLITLYDTLVDVATDRGFITRGMLDPPPAVPSFELHVWPILRRVLDYRWVNQAAQDAHGPNGRGDFTSPRWRTLGDPKAPNDDRLTLLGLLRQPGTPPQNAGRRKMPRLFSDDYLSLGQNQDVLPLTRSQYAVLAAWARGLFTTGPPTQPPVELLPDALTRIALEACVGGAFVPGIEANRIVRNPDIYMKDEPFRISHAQKPGTLTEDMALPWQADFADCAWDTRFNGFGWWPAQRPDDVFTQASPDMQAWIRGFPQGSDIEPLQAMVDHWSELGIVLNIGSASAPNFIEVGRTFSGARKRAAIL